MHSVFYEMMVIVNDRFMFFVFMSIPGQKKKLAAVSLLPSLFLKLLLVHDIFFFFFIKAFFFFLNFYLFIFIFGCVGSSFLCEGFL